jgi:hypothetical protein
MGMGPTSDTPMFIIHKGDDDRMQAVSALAVAQSAGEEDRAIYLFYCNAAWEVVQDDLFSSVEEALHQAGAQYERLEREDWQWMKMQQAPA